MMSRKTQWNVAVLLVFLGAMLHTNSSFKAAEVPVGIKLAEHQHLVINNGTEVTTLDPHGAGSNIPEQNVMINLMEGLFYFNTDGEPVPGVTERWEESSDGMTWTFYLRPTARWSNGEPVTAHDFVYSWRRLADPKTGSTVAGILDDIKLLNSPAVIAGNKPPTALGIKALDNHTLQLQLSQRQPFLIKILAGGMLLPVHRATVEKHGPQWTKPDNYVGNGAYCLQVWKVDEKIVLTRNPYYWDNVATRIDQVTFIALASKDGELMRYRAGEIDIGNLNMPDGNFHNLKQELQQQVRLFSSLSVTLVLFNNMSVPFNNAQVRRALALAFDRQDMTRCPFMQGQQLAYSIIPDGVQGMKVKLPEWATWSQTKRIQVAQTLLQAAGYSAQRPLHFSLLYPTKDKEQQIFLRSQWEKNLPVKVTLENQEWCTYLENLQSGRYQVARVGWLAGYSEPYALLGLLRSNGNYAQYRSQQVDDCLDQILLAKNEIERHRYWQQAERHLEQDMPLIPLIHRNNYRLVKPDVGGLGAHNHTGRIHIKNLYRMKQ